MFFAAALRSLEVAPDAFSEPRDICLAESGDGDSLARTIDSDCLESRIFGERIYDRSRQTLRPVLFFCGFGLSSDAHNPIPRYHNPDRENLPSNPGSPRLYAPSRTSAFFEEAVAVSVRDRKGSKRGRERKYGERIVRHVQHHE